MTLDSYERGLLGNFRMMLAAAGTLFVNNVFTLIAERVNGGEEMLYAAQKGWILAAGNFDADPTSASAIISLAWSYIWVPVIACAIGCVCLFLFDLDKKYDIIVKDLEKGKWKGTSEHADF